MSRDIGNIHNLKTAGDIRLRAMPEGREGQDGQEYLNLYMMIKKLKMMKERHSAAGRTEEETRTALEDLNKKVAESEITVQEGIEKGEPKAKRKSPKKQPFESMGIEY